MSDTYFADVSESDNGSDIQSMDNNKHNHNILNFTDVVYRDNTDLISIDSHISKGSNDNNGGTGSDSTKTEWIEENIDTWCAVHNEEMKTQNTDINDNDSWPWSDAMFDKIARMSHEEKIAIYKRCKARRNAVKRQKPINTLLI